MRRHLIHSPLSAAAKALAVICMGIGLSACERQLTSANLGHVKPEMTTKEVESILGPPNRIEATPEAAASLTPPPLDLEAERAQRAKNREGEGPSEGPREAQSNAIVRYIYQQKDKTVTLTFVGNRLAPNGISGSFE